MWDKLDEEWVKLLAVMEATREEDTVTNIVFPIPNFLEH